MYNDNCYFSNHYGVFGGSRFPAVNCNLPTEGGCNNVTRRDKTNNDKGI